MRLYCAAMGGIRRVLQWAWIEASCRAAGTVLIAPPPHGAGDRRLRGWAAGVRTEPAGQVRWSPASCAPALCPAMDGPLFVFDRGGGESLVQRREVPGAGHRHPVVAAEVADLAFDAALL